MKRRDVVRQIVLGSSVLFIAPAFITSCQKDNMNDTPTGGGNTGGKPVEIDLSAAGNSALANSGGFIVSGNLIIVNNGGSYIALSSVCTHQGCTVGFNPSSGNLPCPCHGSVFALDGSVVNGPASTPLKVFKVTKNGNILTIE
ncbi:MAG: Rieske (2Fe-2S) protein [Bacteroidales bacterium]